MASEPPLREIRFFTVAEVAAILRLSKMAVYKLVHSGEMEAIRVGRSFRIDEISLDRFLGASGRIAVRVYLGDGKFPEPVEDAVLNLLEVYGFTVEHLREPILGSWFREFWSKAKEASPPVDDQLVKIERAIELRGLDRPQSQVDLNQAEAVTRLLGALSPEQNALLQIGSIFLIKVQNTIVVRNLTQVELAYFQRNPALFQKPEAALKVLQEGLAGDFPSAVGEM